MVLMILTFIVHYGPHELMASMASTDPMGFTPMNGEGVSVAPCGTYMLARVQCSERRASERAAWYRFFSGLPWPLLVR